MAQQWLAVAEAASRMKVHPRTIERRIVAGKIDSRRGDDGQVQVLVDIPEIPNPQPQPQPAAAGAPSSEAFETVKEMADRQVDLAAGTASALVRVAQEQALRAEHQLILARADAGRYRRETKWAFASVAAMLICVIGAVWWCTRAITVAQSDSRIAADRLISAEQQKEAAITELSTLRANLSVASAGQAKATGELAAYKEQLPQVVDIVKRNQPTTRPSVISRLSSVFTGE